MAPCSPLATLITLTASNLSFVSKLSSSKDAQSYVKSIPCEKTAVWFDCITFVETNYVNHILLYFANISAASILMQ